MAGAKSRVGASAQCGAALATALALSACAVPQRLESLAIDHNQVVANTADSLTLLNILRARDGRPLHFTSISRLNGNVSMSATGNVGGFAVISGGSTASVSPGVSGTLASNPGFDITIYDGQEFQQGILTPIDAKTIKFYLGTGWRPDLLTYLLVERIDFVLVDTTGTGASVSIGGRRFRPGETVATLNNDPVLDKSARQFTGFVACYTLAAPQGGDANAIGLARTENPGCKGQTVAIQGGGTIDAKLVTDGPTIDLADPAGVAVQILGSNTTIRTQPVITFRSVDGVLYFLGEYARATRQNATTPIYMIPGRADRNERDEALLTIVEGRGSRYDLSAEIDGVAWHIPANSRRSHQIIALIEQLFNLNKKGSAPPLTTAVRVIN